MPSEPSPSELKKLRKEKIRLKSKLSKTSKEERKLHGEHNKLSTLIAKVENKLSK